MFALSLLRAKQARSGTHRLDIVEQFRNKPVEFITDGLGECIGDSWRPWRIVLKAAYGYSLDAEELAFFRTVAGDRDPPRKRVKELWLIVGRRGGKDSIASVIAAEAANYANEGVALRPGERAIVACFATDRDQAAIVYDYTRAYFERIPALRARVLSRLDSLRPVPIILQNDVELRVVTNNFRAPRGRPIATAVFDECLAAGTLISTEYGSKPIEQIAPGERVWTRQGLRRVLDARLTASDAQTYEAHFSNGCIITGTANHPVYSSGSFVALAELKVGDEVLAWSSLFGVNNGGICLRTDTTRIGPANFYIEKFTWTRMASCLQTFMFTISMAIREITTLLTWRPCLLASTNPNTSLKVGLIGQPNSTASVRKSSGGTDSRATAHVRSVGLFFRLLGCARDFARRNAAQSSTHRWIEKLTTNTTESGPRRDITPKSVSVTSIKRSKHRAKVYNLQVDGCPEYFANGVLVHNCAFWRSEDSASPDEETYNAVLPGMGTIPNAMIVGISSAYRETGLLYRKWKENFGKNDDEVLVIMAPTLTFHPTYDKRIIDRALASDPERAAAEYLVQWRKDLADYVSREVAEAAVVNGRILLEPMLSTHYTAFADPSGGSRDSMTLAIAHRDKERGVLDCLLERRAPFNPADVVAEFAGTLKQYKIRSVTGDRYAGEWPKDRFSEHGIAYEASELTKSEIYRDFLPLLNAGKVDMLDNPRMLNQLCSLERRAVRGGRDSIDHPQQGHDDLINAAAGALLLVMDDASQPIRVSDEALARARMPPQMRRPY